MDIRDGLGVAARGLRRAAGMAAVEAVILAATVGPAVAQQMQNGGGSDAPFAPGISTGLNWVQFLGAAIAVVAFLSGCILLFIRQVMAAGGAFLFTGVGAALMANSNSILTALSGLNFG